MAPRSYSTIISTAPHNCSRAFLPPEYYCLTITAASSRQKAQEFNAGAIDTAPVVPVFSNYDITHTTQPQPPRKKKKASPHIQSPFHSHNLPTHPARTPSSPGTVLKVPPSSRTPLERRTLLGSRLWVSLSHHDKGSSNNLIKVWGKTKAQGSWRRRGSKGAEEGRRVHSRLRLC